MKKIISLLLAITMSTGCVSFRSGSLPVIPKEEIKTKTPYSKRDVSFSISYYQQVGSEIIISEKKLKDTIKNSFQESGLFNRIYSTSFSGKSKYHYHFDFKMTGTSYEDQQANGLIAGYTLLTIPTWNNFYIDITMYLFVDGKEVFSITTADRVTDLVWLPFAITWIFANHATMGAYIRKHSLKYFINEIKRNQLYAIPTSDKNIRARPKDLMFLDKENEPAADIEETEEKENVKDTNG